MMNPFLSFIERKYNLLPLSLVIILGLINYSNGWKTLIEDLDDSKFSKWVNLNGTEQGSFICNSNIEILGGFWRNPKISKRYVLDESTDEILLQITYYIETEAYLTIKINKMIIFDGLISSAGQTNSKDFIDCQGKNLYFQDIVTESFLNQTASVLDVEILVGFNPNDTLFMGLYKLKIKVPGLSEGLLAVIIIIPTIAGIGILSFVIWRIRIKRRKLKQMKNEKQKKKKYEENKTEKFVVLGGIDLKNQNLNDSQPLSKKR